MLGLPPAVAERSHVDDEPVTPDGRAARGPLLFDHDEILAAGLRAVRAEYEQRPDSRGFLDRSFTLTELRELHEAVLGERLLARSRAPRYPPALGGRRSCTSSTSGERGRPSGTPRQQVLPRRMG